MVRRWVAVVSAAALAWTTAGGSAAAAGIFRGPWDFSLGPYTGGQHYSYNEAYGYGLPFNTAQFPDVWHYPYGFGYYPVRDAYWDGTYNYYVVPPRHFIAAPCNVPPGAVPANPLAVPGPATPLLPVNPRAAGAAVIEVRLPADAELWFDRDRTGQTGPERVFTSPPLPGGKNYHYVVRARWLEDGKLREQVESVSVRAGELIRLEFPRPVHAE